LRELPARRWRSGCRLGDPTSPALRAHIWTDDKQPWMQIGDDLPVYPKNVTS